MPAKQVNIDQGSSEWHEWRQRGVGASDVAAIFGLSPYKTKRDLWFEKAGLGEPDDEDRSYIFRRGHEMEAEIRELFIKHTKIQIVPACFENGIHLASLDGYEKGVILEAKLVGKEALKRAADSGEIPEHHRIQVQSQLFTAEADKAYWGGRAPKVKGGVVVEIGRDETLIKRIQSEVAEFWESVQLNKVPDLSDGDTLFITSPEQINLFQKLSILKAQKDTIDGKYSELEQQVKAFATHSRVRCGHVSITASERSGSIEYKKIPEVMALPEEYLESFRGRPSKVKTLRFGKAE